ncbi:MAG: ABC transporter substrate-binding protein, partial [Methanophagales archaeon]|nr:ABC transporter substrate-binding protein [Methanophagales archaeon]
KLAIFGKKAKTDLADANNDGKISMLDVGQTKLIILGKEKKLRYIDLFGEAVTVNKPINRLINLGYKGPEAVRAIGARDLIVALGSAKSKIFFPELSKLPAIQDDYEMMLSLEPDAVQTNLEMKRYAIDGLPKKRELQEKLPGIPLICLNMRENDVLPENVRTLGYILDKEDEAKEYIDWLEGHINEFKALTEGLSKDERPKYYSESHGKVWGTVCPGSRFDWPATIGGGYNIVADVIGPDHPFYGHSYFDIEAEWVVEQNPEYMITYRSGASGEGLGGYDTDDPSGVIASIQEYMTRPGLRETDAVKNKHIYYLGGNLYNGGGSSIIGAAYMGKLFQPALFSDIYPQAIHQEFIDRFCPGVDFDVSEHGVFFYPPLG